MPIRKRVYFHYTDLEEYKEGMWRIIRGPKRKEYVSASADLMRSPEEFKLAMQTALKNWPNSCAASLTADAVNKIAFLGHAGCCVAVKSPEDCTRTAWHTLSSLEQDEANRVAAEVLAEWEATTECIPADVIDLFSVASKC